MVGPGGVPMMGGYAGMPFSAGAPMMHSGPPMSMPLGMPATAGGVRPYHYPGCPCISCVSEK